MSPFLTRLERQIFSVIIKRTSSRLKIEDHWSNIVNAEQHRVHHGQRLVLLIAFRPTLAPMIVSTSHVGVFKTA